MYSDFNITETLVALINSFPLDEKTIIIAIDGPSGSGKTTLAEDLRQYLDCNIFHMDEFFLRPEQRLPERYRQPGGNVDYERVRQELVMQIKTDKDFSYRPFDCSIMDFSKPVQVRTKRINLIEGVYSHHPAVASDFNLKIFLHASLEVRKQRILRRSGNQKLQIFLDRWIPLENQYFHEFCIRENAHIVINSLEHT